MADRPAQDKPAESVPVPGNRALSHCVARSMRTPQRALWITRIGVLLTLIGSPICAASLTPDIQRAIRTSTFEVVMKKPEKDPLSYEKPLPLELLPYIQRTDAYQSVGTAFALGKNTYVTAAHVLLVGVDSQYGPPALRRPDGSIYVIDRIIKFSAYQDFVVFSVSNDPATSDFDVNQDPKIDDPVMAVGNALGEGIVIRDGLYTSATAEEQDGRWKWIRFSAAASPGNSGGPLLDAQGRVIGIVIGKSPNENLNYSLPIGQVLGAPENKARFDQRQLISLPYLHGTQTYAFMDGFDLPLNWSNFVRQYQTIIAHHEKLSRDNLLLAHADTMFPRGNGAESILYAPEANSFQPRLIEQHDDGNWSAAAPYYTPTDLPGDGSVSVANEAGAVLVRLVRSDNATDAAFYGDSKAFMDLALKGLNLRRPVGSDQVRVTSLGAALTDTLFVDRYGRRWQERVWAVPFLNIYLYALLLPTPDGYIALIQYLPSSIREAGQDRTRLLANQVDVSLIGTLAQWQAYLARKAWLPTALAEVTLVTSPQWALRAKRFEFTVPTKLLSLNEKSVMTLTMGFVPEGDQALWDVEDVWWNRDAQQKVNLGLWRRLRPPATAKLELRSSFDNMRNRRDPYAGQWSRDTDTTSAMSIIVDAPGKKAGLVSADLVYGLTLRSDNETRLDSPVQVLQQLSSAARILEIGPGESIVPAQPLPSTMAEAFDTLTRSFLDKVKQSDSTIGRDLRGRVPSEDVAKLVASIRPRYIAPGANAEQLEREFTQRAQELENYWNVVPALMHNRDMWGGFLARNHRDLNTPHNLEVIGAEKALTEALHSDEPREDWVSLTQQLLRASQRERAQDLRPLPLSDADYRARLSPCPAPATETSGSDKVKTASIKRTPGEFYPDQSRHLLEEGSVIVSVRVSAAGCGIEFGVAGSSGSAQLDDAAQRFVETFEFLPAEKEGKAVMASKDYKVTFALHD